MKLGLKNKHALVIGASRGLGKSIALSLAEEEAKVGVIARNQAELLKLVDEMGGEAKGHWYYKIDLLPDSAPLSLVEFIQKHELLPDIVIHNLGGTLGIKNPLCNLEEWRSVWRLNFEIAAQLNQYLIPSMQQKKWGRVINISSIAAQLSRGALAYCSVKAALNAYTKNLGCTVASDGVVVCAVMPGAISHPGSHWHNITQKDPDGVNKYLQERMAIQRFANPSEISDCVRFLCSDSASFFCGSVIPLDGGSY